MPSLKINGRTVEVDAEPDTPLLWVLRDHLGMTGTKYGCGIAQCGACTVHVDGAGDALLPAPGRGGAAAARSRPSRACRARSARRCRTAWQQLDVAQCGYCQSGQIMAAAALLAGNAEARPTPTSTTRMTATSAAAAPTSASARPIHHAAELRWRA